MVSSAQWQGSPSQQFSSPSPVHNSPQAVSPLHQLSPAGGHVFHPTETIFELVQDFIGTHVPTKFHEDWTKNVTSRVLTRFYYYSHIRKTATPPGSHVFQPTGTIYELVQDIIRTNVLTKFHEDWTINVTSRVLTRFYYTLNPYKENCQECCP